MLADFSFFIIVFIDSLIVYLVYRALRRYSLVASPSFINHLPWLHGIVKCQSDANFTLMYWDAHARHNQQRPIGFININGVQHTHRSETLQNDW